MRRDPILYFDEVPLYESELDDNGTCALRAKLRVMPTCWFLLLRLYLRVDGALVRLRETRLFCPLPPAGGAGGAAIVLREIKHSEGSVEEIRAAGGPGADGAGFADADAAAQVLAAIAPACVRRFELSRLELPGAAGAGAGGGV